MIRKQVRTRVRFATAGAAAILLVTACSDGGTDAIPPENTTQFASTWGRIQKTILTPTCATSGCHAAGSAGAVESGLTLDAAHAYSAMVGTSPTNSSARADGMLRVNPALPDKSFLYWKLRFMDSPSGRNYGAPMPSTNIPLTNGQIEYIRRWITAGAPATGEVVDTMVLADRSQLVPATFTALVPPAQGFQVHIDPFSVAAHFERELFIYKSVGNSSDVFVNRIETKMRAGSHHLIAYSFSPTTPGLVLQLATPNTIRDIRNPDNSMNMIAMIPMAYHIFFAGSMTQISDYVFPAGVAMRVAAGTSFDLNSHYVNTGASAVTGEAYINLHTTPVTQVAREAKALNMPNTSFTLPPRQKTTVSKTFTVSATTTIFLLTSHMHKRGEQFVIRVKGGPRDGEIVYSNTDWEHPLMQRFETPLVLRAGEGLTSVITYNNDTDRTINFGLTSEDEMGIIFGYYY